MDPEERLAYVAESGERRAAIQKEISRLHEERKQYVAQRRRALGEDDKNTLDEAMIAAIREQAAARRFTLK